MMKNLVELDSWEQDVVFELVTTQVEMLWDSNTEEELLEPDTRKQFMEMNHMIDLFVTVGGLTEPSTKQYLTARHYYFTQKQQDQEQVKLMDEFDGKLVNWCVKYVHDLCTDDSWMLETVTEQIKCSEVDLFDGFENISQVMGFELEEEPVEMCEIHGGPKSECFGCNEYKV
jgi:hypothetical protein